VCVLCWVVYALSFLYLVVVILSRSVECGGLCVVRGKITKNVVVLVPFVFFF
jgi:hypothetical protein